jgi:hypothetical protein
MVDTRRLLLGAILRVLQGRNVMDKCTQCDSERVFPMDTEDHECKCGAVYCGECDAEFSKEGELLAYGRKVM